MKVLFTKKISDSYLEQHLRPSHQPFCIDTLEIHYRNIQPFPLKRKSIIFSSVNAVKPFFESGFQPNEDCTARAYNKIYCVGEKTKKEIRKYGFGTFKVTRNAKELSEFIIEKCPNEHFLHFCGNIALDVLNDELPLQNIEYKKVIIYDTIEKHPTYTQDFDAIVFFSPSGVRSFAKNNNFQGKIIFSIGETTTQEIKKYTQQNITTSHENSLNDLIHLINNYTSDLQ